VPNDYSGSHISKYVSLPDTHKIYGALIMGYPRLKFKVAGTKSRKSKVDGN